MAGGSRVVINAQGISIITAGKVVVKASQHVLENGKQIKSEIPSLPLVNEMKTFTNKWDFYDLFYETEFSKVQYKLINSHNNTYIKGVLDEHGRTERINLSKEEQYDILIGTDEPWTVSVDDGDSNEDIGYQCSCGLNDEYDH